VTGTWFAGLRHGLGLLSFCSDAETHFIPLNMVSLLTSKTNPVGQTLISTNYLSLVLTLIFGWTVPLS
jgi:hypothetical protein